MAPGTLLRRLTLATALAVGIVGCGSSEEYASNLTYAVRTDPLVMALPKLQPTGFNNPGRLPLDFLASMPTRFDLEKKNRVIDYARIETLVKTKALTLTENDKALLEESKTNILDPRNLVASERTKIGEVLTKLYGTPAEPKVKVKEAEGVGFAKETVELLKLDPATLKEGSRLYRRHCLHCHGLEGNGRGPTGYWVNPHPRDYRQGVFKFTSSSQDLGERKPRREDIMHVLTHGIEGSSMPSFGMYSKDELEKITSYVIHLSMRGQTEFLGMQLWMTDPSVKLYTPPTAVEIEAMRANMLAEGKPSEEIQKTVKALQELKGPEAEEERTGIKALEDKFGEVLGVLEGWWVAAQAAGIKPDDYPYANDEKALLESAARGAVLFNAGDASCVSCHKNYGREAPYSFDQWGTIVRPRNLIDGYYRGGRRPVDMYYRVYSGINGAGMATYDKTLRPDDKDKAAKQDKIWDLVNFMQVLHYPDLRAKLKKDHGVNID